MGVGTRASSALGVFIGGALALGCGPALKPPTIDALGMETCKVARDPLQPFVVEWNATELTNLEAASNQGVVVVSYAGCTLKVLTGCRAAGTYALVSTSANREAIVIDSNEKLWAQLPLAAASLKAQVAAGRSLTFDYVAVGQRRVSQAPEKVEGQCDGATHFLRGMTVGAFDLSSKAREAVGVEAAVAGTAGGGLEHEAAQGLHKGSGDVAACAKSPEGNGCRSILQLQLEPLPTSGGGASFGAGLGALTKTPTVGRLDVPALGDFDKVDVSLLEALELAKRADKNIVLEPDEKAEAWRRLVAAASGDAAMRKVAQARYDEWMAVVSANAKRDAELERLGARWKDDRAKLERLLRLDESVVSSAQKARYVEAFEAVYGPLAKDLAEWQIKFW